MCVCPSLAFPGGREYVKQWHVQMRLNEHHPNSSRFSFWTCTLSISNGDEVGKVMSEDIWGRWRTVIRATIRGSHVTVSQFSLLYVRTCVCVCVWFRGGQGGKYFDASGRSRTCHLRMFSTLNSTKQRFKKITSCNAIFSPEFWRECRQPFWQRKIKPFRGLNSVKGGIIVKLLRNGVVWFNEIDSYCEHIMIPAR